MYALSLCVAILGLVTYQLAMRAAPRDVNPWWLLTLVYAIAGAGCLAVGFVWRRFVAPGEGIPTADTLGPATVIAGTVILIEIGYLLVYRAGWSMAVAPALAQAVTLSLLAVLGVLVFAEKVGVVRGLGLALCVTGILLVVREA